MNLPTNVNILFYQFQEHIKLVHDSCKPTWHVAHLNVMIVNLYLELLHESSKAISQHVIFIISPPQILASLFWILAFFLFIGSSLLCVFLEAFNPEKELIARSD